MAELYIMGWSGATDWRSKWLGRYQTHTHATLRIRHSRKLSVSLHTDAKGCMWLPTPKLERMYKQRGLQLITPRLVGYTHTKDLWRQGDAFDTWEVIRWWYGGRFIWPDWRPKTCVSNIVKALKFYGYKPPDTAYIDELFLKEIPTCK